MDLADNYRITESESMRFAEIHERKVTKERDDPDEAELAFLPRRRGENPLWQAGERRGTRKK
jgi:hypothetical protein